MAEPDRRLDGPAGSAGSTGPAARPDSEKWDSPLKSNTAYLMRRAHAHVSAAPDRATPARDHAVLAALAAEPGASQQALAERLEINRTIMVKLVDRLQAAGFVTRTRNPEDRRSYLLALTADGRAALAGMEPAIRERDRFLTAALTDAEYGRLNELLRAVLGEPEKTPGTASTEYLVTQVYFLLRRRGDSLVADAGLRIRNFAALRMIDKLGPCPQQQIARALDLGEPAAALVVDELVEKGLVVRGQDPGDRRRYALELTGLGRERLVLLAGAIRQVQAEVAQALGGSAQVVELHALTLRVLGLSPEGLEL